MIRAYFDEEVFKNNDFTSTPLEKGEYDNCEFINCNLSGLDLSGYTFVDCIFNNCNISTCQLNNTAFSNTKFINCKMIGLSFDQCHEYMFSAQFDNCQLNLSSFYKRKFKKAWFKSCQLHEVDFAECDLNHSSFIDCDLEGAIFDHTNLENANLTTARNFIIDPDQNNIKKAKLSLSGLPGLLQKYGIVVEL